MYYQDWFYICHYCIEELTDRLMTHHTISVVDLEPRNITSINKLKAIKKGKKGIAL